MPFTPIKPFEPNSNSGFTPFGPNPTTPPSQPLERLPFKFPTKSETREEKIARYKMEADVAQKESKKANSVKGFLKNTVTAPAMENLPFVGGAIGLSKTLNKLVDNPTRRESQNIIELSGQNQQLLKEIRAKKSAGEDTSKLENIFNSNVDAISQSTQTLNDYMANLPSNSKAMGQLLHTGLDVLTVGTYGKNTAGMKTGVLGVRSPSAITAANQLAKSKAGLFTAQGAKNVVWGALKGGGTGYTYDVALGLEGKRGEDKKGVNALKPGVGTATGAIIGGGIAAGTGLKNSIKEAIKSHKEQAAQQFDKLVGTIVQGKKDDIPRAARALSEIDTTDIKSYKDLENALDDKVGVISDNLDEVLGKNPTLKTIDDLALIKDVNGQKVSHNYVQDSIDQLKELYTKTNDPIGLEQIHQIEAKAGTEGLTIQELNRLAKEYGSEIGTKAFSKAGEPLTSVNAQSLENTRTGIKETAKELFDDPIYNEADKKISDLIRTKELVANVSEKVNQLQQKIKTRGLGERVGRMVFKIVNGISGGSVKGFGESFITRGEGLKTLNALDLERQLQSNLDTVQSILSDPKMSEATVTSRLQSILDGNASTVGAKEVGLNKLSLSQNYETMGIGSLPLSESEFPMILKENEGLVKMMKSGKYDPIPVKRTKTGLYEPTSDGGTRAIIAKALKLPKVLVKLIR